MVVGAVAPASPDPIPIVLLPGFEYRLREWRNPETHEVHWLIERRKPASAAKTTNSRDAEPQSRSARGACLRTPRIRKD